MKKYGAVAYHKNKNEWIITADPHVSLRLKRVFGKLGTHSFGKHELSANEEISRDLIWFLDRYPMKISSEDLKRLKGLSEEYKKTERFIAEFYAGKSTNKKFDLILPARDYQKEAAAMNLKMKGLLLGDDVGLGKTVSFIAMLTEPKTLPAIVVTLAHLTGQWRDMMKQFSPNLKTHIIKKGSVYEIKSPTDVYILNYHKLHGWAETFAKFARTVCFDEIQELRHQGSGKYTAARHLASTCKYRSGLSATPIYNYGGEFFNVVDILRPGVLGSHEEFIREWCTEQYGAFGPRASINNPRIFGAYLKDNGIMLRRTRHQVRREIPAVSKIHQSVDADLEALNNISDSCAELARLILREDKGERGDVMRASEEFSNALRQATGIAKAPYVAMFIRLLIESGEKVILYGWHRAVYAIWNDILKDLKPAMYTGSETTTEKDEAKRRFIEDETNLLIISLRAGQGLDGLQYKCKTVVFGELDYSPGVHEQNIGRVARDGQKYPVMAYFMVSEKGSDPTIAEILGVKAQQIEGVRNFEAPLFEKLQTNPDHIKELARNFLKQTELG